MNKKRIIIFASIAVFISACLLIAAYIVPSEKMIVGCINITPLSEKDINPKNLETAINNYDSCKEALVENDKKIKDENWKSLSTEELYGENGKNPYVTSMEKFIVIKDSLSILDSLVANGTVLSEFKAKLNHDEAGVDQIFKEMETTVSAYKSYNQETKALDNLAKQKSYILKEYFNK